jgi:hypothetical protein
VDRERPTANTKGSDDGDPARLEATRGLRASPSVIRDVLDHPEWLGRLVDPPPGRPDLRRIETDLGFTLGGDAQPLTFTKAAYLELGTVTGDGAALTCEIGWRASTLAPLFPVFAGRLVANGTRLRLTGVYEPPAGGVGLVIDRAFLHHFARRTGRWFLDRVAGEIERRSDPTAERQPS